MPQKAAITDKDASYKKSDKGSSFAEIHYAGFADTRKLYAISLVIII